MRTPRERGRNYSPKNETLNKDRKNLRDPNSSSDLRALGPRIILLTTAVVAAINPQILGRLSVANGTGTTYHPSVLSPFNEG